MPAQHCSKYERYNGECDVFVLVSRDSLAGKTEKKTHYYTNVKCYVGGCLYHLRLC